MVAVARRRSRVDDNLMVVDVGANNYLTTAAVAAMTMAVMVHAADGMAGAIVLCASCCVVEDAGTRQTDEESHQIIHVSLHSERNGRDSRLIERGRG